MCEWSGVGEWSGVDTPQTVMTTKAPPVLKEKGYLVQIKLLNLSLEST